MKQKDIPLILAIVVVSAILSFVIGRLIFTAPKNRQEKVEVVQPIQTAFEKPDSRYFNARSINPTQLIRITKNSNPKPFNGQ